MPIKKIWTKVANNKFTNEPSIILTAVDEMVEFIKPTLGPKIKHILVNQGFKTELMDDGVSIAQEFELDDPYADAVCSYVKEVSQKTDDKAGDGTTTTMVLLQSLLHNIMDSAKTYPEIKKELDKATDEFRAELDNRSKKVTSEAELLSVAKTSMNDDESAKIVAEVVWKTGAKGAVTITDYTGKDIEYEKVEGFTFNRGMIARGMITNRDKQTYEAPNKNFSGTVGVYISEEVIAVQDDIIPILQKAENRGFKNLVVFCPNLIGEAMGIVAFNQSRGAFNICAIPFPGEGEKTKDFIQDLKTVTGWDGEFGTVDKIEAGLADTSLIGGHGDKKEIQSLIKHLQKQSDESKEDYEKDYYHARQARLAGGIVILKVGGTTETEVRLKLKKVEDAVNACKCALEEGVAPGAGITLGTIETSSNILNNSLKSVHEAVCSNADIDPDFDCKVGETINVLTKEKGDFLKVGVVDATKVLRTAVENAVSLATILFSVSGIITNDNQEPKDN